MARRHFGRSTHRVRRVTNWIAAAPVTALQNVAAATKIIDQSFTPSAPVTILRTRGRILFQTDQIAASESAFGAYGMGIVSRDALAAGAASVPGAYSDADWDGWFVHGFWACPTIFGTAVGMHNLSQTFEFDSKAMRKLETADRLIVSVENAHSTDGASFLNDFRILLQES